MRTVIGLAGVKTSGKSTVAEILKKIIGGNILESALADKLKNTSAEVFNLPRDYFDRQDIKEVPLSGGPIILTADHIFDILWKFNVKMDQSEFTEKYSNIIGTELETPRKIAQIVGTEVLRATGDEDIHCKNMPMNEEGITIVSDLRFPNEFEYFENAEDVNFIPLYIKRDVAEAQVTENSHASETSVFKFTDKCNEIPNNGTLENLEEQLTRKFRSLTFCKEA